MDNRQVNTTTSKAQGLSLRMKEALERNQRFGPCCDSADSKEELVDSHLIVN